MSPSITDVDRKSSSPPWWKFGHVWLVIAGPALVVVASFATLYLAITRPDPVVTDDDLQIRQQRAVAPGRNGANLAPAVQARNHAATGVIAPAPPAMDGPGVTEKR